MGRQRPGAAGDRDFVARAVAVMGDWLEGKLSNAQAAEWAFQNTSVMEKREVGGREAEALWRALAALAMLSSCQPEEMRSTRREMEQARRALQATLNVR